MKNIIFATILTIIPLLAYFVAYKFADPTNGATVLFVKVFRMICATFAILFALALLSLIFK